MLKCKSCLIFCTNLTNWEHFLPPSSPCDWIFKQIVSYLQQIFKNTDNWKNTTALWNKFKKNLTAVRNQNNFWIIKPFYHLSILSFSFYLFSSILPPAGGHTLDRAPFTSLCLHLFVWPSYILFWCFSLKFAPGPTSCSIMIFTQYMFHLVLPSGVQSVYGVRWWQLLGTYDS